MAVDHQSKKESVERWWEERRRKVYGAMALVILMVLGDYVFRVIWSGTPWESYQWIGEMLSLVAGGVLLVMTYQVIGRLQDHLVGVNCLLAGVVMVVISRVIDVTEEFTWFQRLVGQGKVFTLWQKLDSPVLVIGFLVLMLGGFLIILSSVGTQDRLLLALNELESRIKGQAVIEEELKQAKREAELAAQAKAEFLAIVSHEFRTPLNGVLGLSQALMDGGSAVQQREFIQLIHRSVENTLFLLDDILDFSKAEAKHLQLVEKPFLIREVLEDVLVTFYPVALEKGLELSGWVEEEVPVRLVGDAKRIRQILLNLVNNGIKFTFQGEVRVLISWNEEEGRLKVMVKDTGAGIPLEAQKRLFQPFVQVHDGASGTGLGLSICKRMVEMMRGQIGVRSEVGAGAEIEFEIPLQEDEVGGGKLSIPGWAPTLALVRVDRVSTRRVLEYFFKAWAWRFEILESDQDLSHRIRDGAAEDWPKVLLFWEFGGAHKQMSSGLQVMMTRVSAWRIRQIWWFLRVVEERAFPTPIGAKLSRGNGVVTRKKLLDVVDMLGPATTRVEVMIRPLGGIEKTPVKPAPDTGGGAEGKASNLPGDPVLRVLVAEDNLVNQKVVTLQLAKLGHRVRVVPNGKVALEAMQEEVFDVVLMDCQMPEMDGYEATQRIRRESNQRSIWIIAMTAKAMKGDREKCLEVGMDDYVAKPLQVGDLREVLSRWQPVSRRVVGEG